MWTIIRSFPAWFVTAVDDVFVQQLWAHLRGREPRRAVRLVADLVTGWAPLLLILAGLAAAATIAAAALR